MRPKFDQNWPKMHQNGHKIDTKRTQKAQFWQIAKN